MGLFSSIFGGGSKSKGGGGSSSSSNQSTTRSFEFFQPDEELRKKEVKATEDILEAQTPNITQTFEALTRLLPFREDLQTAFLEQGASAIPTIFDTVLQQVTAPEEDNLFKDVFRRRKTRLRESFGDLGTRASERFASLGTLGGGAATDTLLDLGTQETRAVDDAALDVALQALTQRESGINQLLSLLGLSSNFGGIGVTPPVAGRLQTQAAQLANTGTQTTGSATGTTGTSGGSFDKGKAVGSAIGAIGGSALGLPPSVGGGIGGFIGSLF